MDDEGTWIPFHTLAVTVLPLITTCILLFLSTSEWQKLICMGLAIYFAVSAIFIVKHTIPVDIDERQELLQNLMLAIQEKERSLHRAKLECDED